MHAQALANHHSLVLVVSAAFGGKTESKGSEQYDDMTRGAATLEEAVANINAALTI